MIFAKNAAIFLLLVLCMAALKARAQNQTPANVPSVGWTDPATGLTWTKQNNGSDVNWNQANDYCSNLRLGGFSDWRLPTIDELQDIYDPGIDIPGQAALNGSEVIWHVKGNLKVAGGHWSSTQKKAEEAWQFDFVNGNRISYHLYDVSGDRALCVRR
jgi:hypothetical protein